MNKIIAIFLVLFPVLALADGSSMSFTPPATDYSVIFLGNIFGIVDGVLHGNGSQILGSMFAVFNSAVLALGGIFIMYTLMVSTMNTAHEGQMMGQKWSSMWIPIRSTVGMTLLIPKASGYCMMQVFVMWIVVQGVGAADKVWDAALSYLNRGGVIIQAQLADPTVDILKVLSDTPLNLPMMAQRILAGQVCMLGLQTQMQDQLRSCQANSNASTLCRNYLANNSNSGDNYATIPDFINSVDIIAEQNPPAPISSPTAKPSSVVIPTDSVYSVSMPNLSSSSPFAALNGICGVISWKSIPETLLTNINNTNRFQPSDLSVIINTRAIALQQMYMDLSTIAHTMVANNPGIGPLNPNAEPAYSSVAQLPFGIPENAATSGTAGPAACTKASLANCFLWGSPSKTLTPLLNGPEFKEAIGDYNSVMLPTLQLIKSTKGAIKSNTDFDFIRQASSSGWIMAGSYFFDLVKLNMNSAQGVSKPMLTEDDDDIKLDNGFSSSKDLNTSEFLTPNKLANFLTTNQLTPIIGLINGNAVTNPPSTVLGKSQMAPKLGTSLDPVVDTIWSSTVYGYTTNSYIMPKPGQPGQAPLAFAGMMNISVDPNDYALQPATFDCGSVNFGLVRWCLGAMFGEIFYNFLFLMVYNIFITMFGTLINQVIMAFLMAPLEGIATIFQTGLALISKPGVNPIVGLAQMGTYYINFASQLWLILIEKSIVAILIPVFGLFILALIMMSMPLLMAWLGVMVGIGFSTAYYVPMLPYILFTFGSIAWLMAVIEAMVAAPIVALGVTHPEGHESFGKGEPAIMILMNVFLRPSMMIIGYITAISLSYVCVWIINAGFDHAVSFIQTPSKPTTPSSWFSLDTSKDALISTGVSVVTGVPGAGQGLSNASNPLHPTNQGLAAAGMKPTEGGYVGWAGTYAFFFSILVYTTLYLTVVQKSFTLIAALPDKVLRWIGGQPESSGSETAQWGQEAQQKMDKAGDATSAGKAQMDKQLSGAAGKALEGAKESSGGSGTTSAGEPPPKDGGGDGGGNGGPPAGGSPPAGGPPSIPPEAAAL